jgi:hypothetical protein
LLKTNFPLAKSQNLHRQLRHKQHTNIWYQSPTQSSTAQHISTSSDHHNTAINNNAHRIRQTCWFFNFSGFRQTCKSCGDNFRSNEIARKVKKQCNKGIYLTTFELNWWILLSTLFPWKGFKRCQSDFSLSKQQRYLLWVQRVVDVIH